MRHYFLVKLVLCAAVIPASFALAAVTPQEQTFISQHIGDLVKVEPTRLQGLALDQVFQAPIYSIKVTVAGGTQTVLAARVESDLVDISLPNTTAAMPRFLKLISPKFKLAGEKDAQAFQEALDALYPIDTDFSKDDLKAKAIKHSGTTWTFVRGKFFDHLKGFVVTTDAAGTVTEIKYSLSIH
jgi:hypothetical protein